MNSPWKSSKSAQFERDVDIWQNAELLDVLSSLNLTKETISEWRRQLLCIEEKRKSVKESAKSNSEGDGKKEKPIMLSQGSCRVLSALYRSLLFIFQNSNEYLGSYRLVRMREYKVGI